MSPPQEFTDALANIQTGIAAINSHIRAVSPPPQPASPPNEEVLAALVDALRTEVLNRPRSPPTPSSRNGPRMKVPKTKVQRSPSPTPVIQSFEQEEDILTVISDTLQRYPIASTFKEYLANAEDSGGATKISWLLDGTEHPARKLISPELAECQGPALACFNDGSK